MTKEVQVTVRVESALRTEFSQAALLQDRSAAQVLRELMRDYVQQSRSRGQRPASKSLAATESHRREQALNFARASVGLEGFKPLPEDEALSRLYVAGDITIADAIRAVNEAAQSR
ncbi:antitoxin VbhA family protein [Amphibiibacter pelophylacis]|uniref:Antitoxin VbhA family protein n=1 Tax=Amphibiibacter pelophylacis TaxID=1799477 RepID=A0ACC6P0Y9_9BURK